MEQFFNKNKTFLLVVLAMIGAMVLIMTGHLGSADNCVVSIGEYTTLTTFLTGIYATKSGISKFAKKKE